MPARENLWLMLKRTNGPGKIKIQEAVRLKEIELLGGSFLTQENAIPGTPE